MVTSDFFKLLTISCSVQEDPEVPAGGHGAVGQEQHERGQEDTHQIRQPPPQVGDKSY